MNTISYNGYTFSSDKSRIDIEYVHRYLSEQSYWARKVPLDVVKASVENSFCVAAYERTIQIGFARMITDHATFGYLADVFIDKAHRGKGLSIMMVEFILSFEDIKKLRRIMLGTEDAHGLYERFGFTLLKHPGWFMEIRRPDVYS